MPIYESLHIDRLQRNPNDLASERVKALDLLHRACAGSYPIPVPCNDPGFDELRKDRSFSYH